ncbi:MAG: hypothetical protein N2652_05925 [Kiritimatiellae bacterium]|nr:hypothetical protein [Kiritimatiellia bacterium]
MRRLSRPAALIAAAAASAAWIAHVPYRPASPARAVPYGARWISRHRAPAARWHQIRRSPLADLAGRLAGAPPPEWSELLASEETAAWVRRFGSREVWLFDLHDRDPSTVGAAAWLGGAAWRWRIALHAGWIRGWRRYADHRGRTIWLWPRRLGTNGPFLSIALEEGLLLACLSPRPADMTRLLDAYDGTTPRSPDSVRLQGRPDSDLLLVQLGRGPGPDLIEIKLDSLDGARIRGTAHIEGWELAPPPRGSPAASAPPPSRLVAALLDHAAATLILPPEAADRWWPDRPAGWLSELRALLRSATGSPWILTLHDEPLAGRLLGIRVPGVILSMPLADLPAFERQLDELFDRWNAASQWGLIRGPAPRTPQLRVIESAGGGPLRRWLGSSGLAYRWADGWLTLAGSAETLQTLLAAESAVVAAPATALPADGRPRASARGAALASTLRLAVAAYVLYRAVSDPEGSERERAALLAAIPSLDVLRELDRLEMTLDTEDARWRIEFAALLAPGEAPRAASPPTERTP